MPRSVVRPKRAELADWLFADASCMAVPFQQRYE